MAGKSTESKTVKEALKEARELIANKDHKAALRSCKRALNVDKNNPMALVFCGLCFSELEQPEQALLAYKKAIDNAPDQLTPWQGLAAFYEKHGVKSKDEDYLTSMCNAYRKLLSFYSESKDVAKYMGVSEKLSNILTTKLKAQDEALVVLQDRIKFVEINAEDKVYGAHNEIVKLLSVDPNLSDANVDVLKHSLNCVISDSTGPQNVENLKSMIRLLYKTREMEDLTNVVFKMNKLFPENSYPLEWICKIYLEYATESLSFKSDVLEDHVESCIDKLMSTSDSSSALAKMARGALLWKVKSDIQGAIATLTEGLDESKNPNFYATYILTQCYLKTNKLALCETTLITAMTLLDKVKEVATREAFEKELKTRLVEVQYDQSKFDKVIENAKCLDTHDLKVLLLKSHASLGQDDCVRNLSEERGFETHELLLAKAMLLNFKGQTREAMETLDEYMNKVETPSKVDFEALLLKAKLQWQNQEYDAGHQSFLKAAKANPHSWVPFLFLGHYYFNHANVRDLERARKCYMKSFSLNPTSSEAGAALSDIYRSQGKWEENFDFLLSVTQKTSSSNKEAKWAHLRLGMHFLAIDEPSKAIVSLQSVLRSDPGGAWESLADAYLARGSLTSALKAYDKVLALCKDQDNINKKDDGIYASLQIATIKHKLGHFRDAIVAQREILEADPHYIPALKGLGESLVAEAKDLLEQCLDLSAVDHCTEAICCLTEAIKFSGADFCCVWKLLGEALAMFHHFPNQVTNIEIPAELLDDQDNSKGDKIKADKRQLLSLASKCFVRALKIQPDNVSCWQDLAISYHYQLVEFEKSKSGQALVAGVKAKCFTAARKALVLSPENPELWSALGVYAAFDENFGLAQHAFIQSVQLDNNATAWANLGTVYFMLGKFELANQAFREAQSQDPGFLGGWVGQALIAEATGYEEDAMDIFRHSTYLGNGLESEAGYGHWVCKTLIEMAGESAAPGESRNKHSRYCIEKMFGVTVAVDSLTRYVNRDPNDVCALNMLGVLLEREGQLRNAKTMLVKALDLTEESGLRDIICHNLARIHYKLGDYESSVGCNKAISGEKDNFYAKVGLALASFKAGLYQESYNAYAEALNITLDNEQRSHVLAAMATIAYKFQGGDAAKTLLFQSCQLQPPSLQGVLALSVLGIKQSDPTLLKAALTEMDKPRPASAAEVKDDQLGDMVAMKALVLALQGHKNQARQMISKAIHKSPQIGSLWKTMAMHILTHDKDNSELIAAAAKCAQKSVRLASSSKAATALDTMTLVGLCLLNVDPDLAMKEALKTVHTYPDSLEAWALLVASTASRPQLKTRIISNAKSHFDNSPNETLKKWICAQ